MITISDYKAMAECANSIGDSAIKRDKETLQESVKETKKGIFESIGDSVEQPKDEEVEFYDGVAMKALMGVK